MRSGYEMLRERIVSHPEEFDFMWRDEDMDEYTNTPFLRSLHPLLGQTSTKWDSVLEIAFDGSRSRTFITSQQRQELEEALYAAQRVAFARRVLEILAHECEGVNLQGYALECAKYCPELLPLCNGEAQ
jgi:hypothetical protein